MIVTKHVLDLMASRVSKDSLHKSCWNRSIPAVKWQLRYREQIEDSENFIHTAVLFRHEELLKILMAEKFSVATNTQRLAASRGHLEILKLLVTDYLPSSVLVNAVNSGSVKTVRWVLDRVLEISKDPLIHAVDCNQVKIAEILLQHKAPIHPICLKIALKNNRKRLVHLLLRYGAKLEPSDNVEVHLKLERFLETHPLR